MFDTDVLIEGRKFPGYVNWFQAVSPIKNDLNSGFSIHLFQIFQAKRNQMLKYQQQTKLLYRLSALKKTLGVQNKYADWRNFKRKVIDLAVREINQYTNIKVDFRVIKKNGQVFSLEFEIRDRKNKANKRSPSLTTKVHLNDLSFAQLKALNILTNYRITQELALEMINRAPIKLQSMVKQVLWLIGI